MPDIGIQNDPKKRGGWLKLPGFVSQTMGHFCFERQ